MYQLATLSSPPRPKGYRQPGIRGLTYGPKLAGTSYSNTLKNLIWKCLSEKPHRRPHLVKLQDRIRTVLEAVGDIEDNYKEKDGAPGDDEAPDEPQPPGVQDADDDAMTRGLRTLRGASAAAAAAGGGGAGPAFPALPAPDRRPWTSVP